MSNDRVIENLPVEAWLDEFMAHTRRWGKLASGQVPRAHVATALEFLYEKIDALEGSDDERIAELENELEETKGELTTANRRIAAAKARETKLRNELKELKNNAE